jgi:hypothetical protein
VVAAEVAEVPALAAEVVVAEAVAAEVVVEAAVVVVSDPAQLNKQDPRKARRPSPSP